MLCLYSCECIYFRGDMYVMLCYVISYDVVLHYRGCSVALRAGIWAQQQ